MTDLVKFLFGINSGRGRQRRGEPIESVLMEAAENMRAVRPGEMMPECEYEWEAHGYRLGMKDHRGVWWRSIFISAPVHPEDFSAYLRGLADVLDAQR
jgi:hypothetical protein